MHDGNKNWRIQKKYFETMDLVDASGEKGVSFFIQRLLTFLF